MIVALFGGGVNSTALLIGLVERGESVDLILFADTGGEKPHTYKHIGAFSAWLIEHGLPPILTVKKVKRDGSIHELEQDCLEKKMLPSLAYGFKSCSQKFKIQPQDKFCNNLPACKAEWKAGRKVLKLIGYDADEERRAKFTTNDKYDYRYPLIEWGWGRDECIEAIERAGLTQPGKSSCFFCPASRLPEILELREKYPALMDRALRMEGNAELTSVKGLGRRFNWRDFLVKHDAKQAAINPPETEIACGCYDG